MNLLFVFLCSIVQIGLYFLDRYYEDYKNFMCPLIPNHLPIFGHLFHLTLYGNNFIRDCFSEYGKKFKLRLFLSDMEIFYDYQYDFRFNIVRFNKYRIINEVFRLIILISGIYNLAKIGCVNL